jgi:RNA polymerase sigma-70 factor (ECF subfamily)
MPFRRVIGEDLGNSRRTARSQDEAFGVQIPTTRPGGTIHTSDQPAHRDDGEYRLARLFDDCYERIRRYCAVRAGSDAVAADVTADTFADAARALARDPGADVDQAWLYMVARRRLTDHWRSAERQRRKLRRLLGTRLQFTVAGPDVDDHDHRAIERVRHALDSLPDRQRAALTLRYLDECSVTEIAEQLDLTYRAAESLLARARRAFVAAWRNP